MLRPTVTPRPTVPFARPLCMGQRSSPGARGWVHQQRCAVHPSVSAGRAPLRSAPFHCGPPLRPGRRGRRPLRQLSAAVADRSPLPHCAVAWPSSRVESDAWVELTLSLTLTPLSQIGHRNRQTAPAAQRLRSLCARPANRPPHTPVASHRRASPCSAVHPTL